MNINNEEMHMNNRMRKPMLTSEQLVSKMRNEKGITFRYISEEKAVEYLTDTNNYLRTASYRQNFQKYMNGVNKGKYIDLDFAYLQELSTIDMHFRFIISKMCMDIEQALKVKLIKHVMEDTESNGYDIVTEFLSRNPYIVQKIETITNSPFTKDLIYKYFTVERIYNSHKRKYEHKITAFDDCPIWVLCEILTFGDFLYLYEFYYGNTTLDMPSVSILNLVKSLRNGTAHNNCLLANLSHGTSLPPKQIKEVVKQIDTITTSQRQKKLSNRPMLEFTALIWVYSKVITRKVKYHRCKELEWLFFTRMPEKKEFFLKNELILSNYKFSCKIIKGFL